jgi:hypothetical protein
MTTHVAADTVGARTPREALARRQFVRQGQLAGTALGGIVTSVVVGLLPAQIRLVPSGQDLGDSTVQDILRWYAPILVGMGAGYVAWVIAFEHRRPSLRGSGWTSERDWAITGGLFAAFLLTRLFSLSDPTAVSGLHGTAGSSVAVLVDAPVDIARTMIRFLASGSISAILFRVASDWRDAFRARRGVARDAG